MALADALHEWEQMWRATGAPVDEILSAGLRPDEVRAAIGREAVHPDVLTWFGWHNGAHGLWDAVPSGRHMFGLDTLLQLRPLVKKWAEAIRPPATELQYREAFFPLLNNDDNDTVLVDLDTGEVVRHEIEEMVERSPTLLLIGEDLESVVRVWMDLLRGLHVKYEPGQVYFDIDKADVPVHLLERGIVIA